MKTQAVQKEEGAGLRVRKKIRIRERLVRVSMELFSRKGFEATTVEEIARAAGVSRRTFFRYFPAKELLVFSHQDFYFAQFRRMLDEKRSGETPFDAVRRALLSLACEFMKSRADHLQQQRIIQRSAVLIARGDAFDDEWEALIAARLGAQATDPAARRRARYLAGAFLGISRTTLKEWYADDCRSDLVKMGKEAFTLIEPAIRFGRVVQTNRK
jgi:AcrR family transcriptional regulator